MTTIKVFLFVIMVYLSIITFELADVIQLLRKIAG